MLLLTRTEGMNERRKSFVHTLLKTEQALTVLSLKVLGYALGIQYAFRKLALDLVVSQLHDFVSFGGLSQKKVLLIIQRRCNRKHSAVLFFRVVVGNKARTFQGFHLQC